MQAFSRGIGSDTSFKTGSCFPGLTFKRIPEFLTWISSLEGSGSLTSTDTDQFPFWDTSGGKKSRDLCDRRNSARTKKNMTQHSWDGHMWLYLPLVVIISQEFTPSPFLRHLRAALAPCDERAAKWSLGDTLDGLSVGSQLLVKVINLSKEPIRRQFRRLMAARWPTARAGPSAKPVVAFMHRDERKTSSATPAVSARRWKVTYLSKAKRLLLFERQERCYARYTQPPTLFWNLVFTQFFRESLELCAG